MWVVRLVAVPTVPLRTEHCYQCEREVPVQHGGHLKSELTIRRAHLWLMPSLPTGAGTQSKVLSPTISKNAAITRVHLSTPRILARGA